MILEPYLIGNVTRKRGNDSHGTSGMGMTRRCPSKSGRIHTLSR